jgi:hypothetical protein
MYGDSAMLHDNLWTSLAHFQYYQKHKNDQRFPLDGSDWARLVQMRLHAPSRVCCAVCADPIDRAIYDWVLIQHNHEILKMALSYWFHNLDTTAFLTPRKSFSQAEQSGEMSLKRLDEMERQTRSQSLNEVETNWFETKQGTDIDPESYWAARSRKSYASKTAEKHRSVSESPALNEFDPTSDREPNLRTWNEIIVGTLLKTEHCRQTRDCPQCGDIDSDDYWIEKFRILRGSIRGVVPSEFNQKVQ